VQLAVTTDGKFIGHYLAWTLQQRTSTVDQFVSTADFKGYADAGSSIYITVNRSAFNAPYAIGVDLSVSGYLI
jgi:hypothetical protein